MYEKKMDTQWLKPGHMRLDYVPYGLTDAKNSKAGDEENRRHDSWSRFPQLLIDRQKNKVFDDADDPSR